MSWVIPLVIGVVLVFFALLSFALARTAARSDRWLESQAPVPDSVEPPRTYEMLHSHFRRRVRSVNRRERAARRRRFREDLNA